MSTDSNSACSCVSSTSPAPLSVTSAAFVSFTFTRRNSFAFFFFLGCEPCPRHSLYPFHGPAFSLAEKAWKSNHWWNPIQQSVSSLESRVNFWVYFAHSSFARSLLASRNRAREHVSKGDLCASRVIACGRLFCWRFADWGTSADEAAREKKSERFDAATKVREGCATTGFGTRTRPHTSST